MKISVLSTSMHCAPFFAGNKSMCTFYGEQIFELFICTINWVMDFNCIENCWNLVKYFNNENSEQFEQLFFIRNLYSTPLATEWIEILYWERDEKTKIPIANIQNKCTMYKDVNSFNTKYSFFMLIWTDVNLFFCSIVRRCTTLLHTSDRIVQKTVCHTHFCDGFFFFYSATHKKSTREMTIAARWY